MELSNPPMRKGRRILIQRNGIKDIQLCLVETFVTT